MVTGNLFEAPEGRPGREVFDSLVATDHFKVERIYSTGQATPAGEWYDQPRTEWVVLLSGSARLRFENETNDAELRPGDYVCIPAHCRHRVEWTDSDHPTVWLAIHYDERGPALEPGSVR